MVGRRPLRTPQVNLSRRRLGFNFPQDFDQLVRFRSVPQRAVDDLADDTFGIDDVVVKRHLSGTVGFGAFLVQVDREREVRGMFFFDLLETFDSVTFFAINDDHFAVQLFESRGVLLQLDQLPSAMRSPMGATEKQRNIFSSSDLFG